MRSPLKKIETKASELFLTFDDGPAPQTTESILKMLSHVGAKATFFVIGNQAEKHTNLLQEILSEGHTLGNHSWDHRYNHYFHEKEHLKNWVVDSQNRLADLIGQDPIAFRSPAGVVTPPLKAAMSELDIPWVHWNKRFFDTNVPLSWTFPWSRFKRGDILLLHDRQKIILNNSFLKTLSRMLAVLRDKGFDIHPLNKERFLNGR